MIPDKLFTWARKLPFVLAMPLLVVGAIVCGIFSALFIPLGKVLESGGGGKGRSM
jgi:hypothetical protein